MSSRPKRFARESAGAGVAALFGRERVDLSKVTLTHHSLRNAGRQHLNLGRGEAPKLPPMDAVGSGAVQDKEKAFLDEIIQNVNGLFDGELR